MEANIKELLEFAQHLAKAAAGGVGGRFGRVPTRRKADRTVVTEVDIAVQDCLASEIAEHFPEHAVVAEEAGNPHVHASPASARYCWVIDPIDGTRNFAAGFPCFATSIALVDRGEPVVGVVVEHNLGHVYAAGKGLGATLNGALLQAAEPAGGEDWLVGVASNRDPLTVGVVQCWLATRGYVLRNTGSTAMHLALVASGAMAGTFCRQCKVWDIAAGAILVSEAGGVMTDPCGKPRTPFSMTADPSVDLPILAGARGAHAALLASIAPVVGAAG